MKNRDLNMSYAIQKGYTKHISEVESGLKCQCICPSCEAKLIARKGDRKVHHFAHYKSDTCDYGYETSLHLAAKELLKDTPQIEIPDLFLSFSSSKEDELIQKHQYISIFDVKIEKRLGGIIPDVILNTSMGDMIIEIYVTHAIDENKLSNIREHHIPTIEINLSKLNTMITKNELLSILENGLEYKEWKYHPKIEELNCNFIKHTELLKKEQRGLALHVDHCPIISRIFKTKSYANYIHDYIGCAFNICDVMENSILCSGKDRISVLTDFDLTQDERNLKYSELLYRGADYPLCRKCHAKLIFKKGIKGHIYHCENCDYTRRAEYDVITGEVR